MSASRRINKVSFYTDDKAELRRAIQRSSLKLVASDIVKPRHRQVPPLQPLAAAPGHWQRLASLARVRVAWQAPPACKTTITTSRKGRPVVDDSITRTRTALAIGLSPRHAAETSGLPEAGRNRQWRSRRPADAGGAGIVQPRQQRITKPMAGREISRCRRVRFILQG